MNILFVFPQYPDTFWSFKHALPFVSKKAGNPPLGLLTVAAMVPQEWQKKLIDLNVESLHDDDILWADLVFLSGMSVQYQSARNIIDRCKVLGKKIVAGGPLFTARYDEFDDVDYLVLNEAEITLQPFLNDLRDGKAKHIYTTKEWADVTETPIPLWELISFKHYAMMNIQYSRGCPYDCEFCDITVLYGRRPRTKSAAQLINEFESLYNAGWRGHVFLVDDNFIGNKGKVKREVLPALAGWMKKRKNVFSLSTEASLNLADDDELLHGMVEVGFVTVFIGIESPNAESLAECGKTTNRNRDMIASIKKLQHAGLQVQGGFIVGFDNDPKTIFDRLSAFIQESGIVTAMVGLLNAPRGTKLYNRLKLEGRLLQTMSGDNTDFSMNFIPKMNIETLVKGYREILEKIYSHKEYYARVRYFLNNYKPKNKKAYSVKLNTLSALAKSIVLLGMLRKGRYQYWKLFVWSLFKHPRLFPDAITFAIYGFHFRSVFKKG